VSCFLFRITLCQLAPRNRAGTSTERGFVGWSVFYAVVAYRWGYDTKSATESL